jgi:cytochrome P450
MIWVHQLHHNHREWIEPEKFIPERFEGSSPYYKTPSGGKRNLNSFGPFLGGKRVCIGKTFSEMALKTYFLGIINTFDVIFDKEVLNNKPVLNIDITREPTIMVNLSSR